MITEIPKNDINIDKNLVKELIKFQFSEKENLKISFLASGWDNVNYRVGENYIIRLPRRKIADKLIKNEIKILPKIATLLPIKISKPIMIGKPTDFYPYNWSISEWINGNNASEVLPNKSQAIKLIRFLKNLHEIELDETPYNKHRAKPISNKSDDVLKRIFNLKKKNILISKKIENIITKAINEKVPNYKGLIHGDLHPKNIIVNNSEISGVIDWGDITSGDPANDLSSIWMLFSDKKTIEKAFIEYKADKSLIIRSKGWAVFFATIFLDLEKSNDKDYNYSKIGHFILKNLESN